MIMLRNNVATAAAVALVAAGGIALWLGSRNDTAVDCCAPPGADSVPAFGELIARVENGIVGIDVSFPGGGGQNLPIARGTGFVHSAEGVICTAADLLRPPPGAGESATIAIVTRDGRVHAGVVREIAAGATLAFIHFRDSISLPVVPALSDSAPRPGDKGYALGFARWQAAHKAGAPQTDEPRPLVVATDLVVDSSSASDSAATFRVIANSTASVGGPGSPVIDRRGRIAGILLRPDSANATRWLVARVK